FAGCSVSRQPVRQRKSSFSMARAAGTWPTTWNAKNFPYRPVFFFLLAILLIVAAGLAYMNGLIFRQTVAPTYQSAPVVTGNIVSSISATGPITSPSSLPLTFKNNGKLAELNVQVGDKVTEGQVLARLDTTDLQTQLAQAQAQLAQAGANAAKAAQGPTEEAIGVAAAQVQA